MLPIPGYSDESVHDRLCDITLDSPIPQLQKVSLFPTINLLKNNLLFKNTTTLCE